MATNSPFHRLRFDNDFLRRLPKDVDRSTACRQVANSCYSFVDPTPLQNPSLVAVSDSALQLIGLTANAVLKDPAEAAQCFSGNESMLGAEPCAHCYCGHQFGSFAGQLGDGAAITLGQILVKEDGTDRWELQLKGAGMTPYSRGSDGRKVLRSSIREFLCSEAMHYLGIPTTRACAITTSESTVDRDPFYTGRTIQEKCTVVARIAQTYLRFGSFEICKPVDEDNNRPGPSDGNTEVLYTLVQYTVSTYFPDIYKGFAKFEDRCREFFREVVKMTASLVAKWQCVGFCHGVLNTDNMSIIGLTIDYGPFAFMGHYDTEYVCNGSDNSGRYRFGAQPAICKWNLGKLAEALELVSPGEPWEEVLNAEYEATFVAEWQRITRCKLGILDENAEGLAALINGLYKTFQQTNADFTDTFVALLDVSPDVPSDCTNVARAIARACATPQDLVNAAKVRLRTTRNMIPAPQIDGLLALAETDPQALQAIFNAPLSAVVAELENEKKKAKLISDTHKLINKYSEMSVADKRDADMKLWEPWLREYQKEFLGAQTSREVERQKLQRAHNPRFVLRSWIAQDAIDKAEKGDFSRVNELLDRLTRPFEEDKRDYTTWGVPPAEKTICVTCSS